MVDRDMCTKKCTFSINNNIHMTRYLQLTFIFSLILNFCFAQNFICTEEDKKLFSTKLQEIQLLAVSDTAENTIEAIGKLFLDTPYVAKTLEIGTKESLVINLRGLDCTTFIENVLAFHKLRKGTKNDLDTYIEALKGIRYRDGVLNGYPSRLHYFSDWIMNNEKKGIVRDITSELGGEELDKEINFMSTHRDAYPFLSNDQNYKAIAVYEKELNQKQLCYLPKDRILEVEKYIQSGDIIALTTTIKGLDITHTGIAILQEDNRIYLLHASTIGKVVISKLPLTEYLKKIKNNSGIMIARPL